MRSILILAAVSVLALTASGATAQTESPLPWHFATWHSNHHAVIGPFNNRRQCELIRADWLEGASSNSHATQCWQA